MLEGDNFSRLLYAGRISSYWFYFNYRYARNRDNYWCNFRLFWWDFRHYINEGYGVCYVISILNFAIVLNAALEIKLRIHMAQPSF